MVCVITNRSFKGDSTDFTQKSQFTSHGNFLKPVKPVVKCLVALTGAIFSLRNLPLMMSSGLSHLQIYNRKPVLKTELVEYKDDDIC